LRCLNAFLRWAYEEQIIKELVKLSWLKEEDKIVATFSEEQVRRLISYKPHSRKANRYGKQQTTLERLHTITCLLLDTGLRISEALSLSRSDVDFDNMVLKIKGKDNKHRLIPFSCELRRILWRHCARHGHTYLFTTKFGSPTGQRDFLRDFKSSAQVRILPVSGLAPTPAATPLP